MQGAVAKGGGLRQLLIALKPAFGVGMREQFGQVTGKIQIMADDDGDRGRADFGLIVFHGHASKLFLGLIAADKTRRAGEQLALVGGHFIKLANSRMAMGEIGVSCQLLKVRASKKSRSRPRWPNLSVISLLNFLLT